ncbi:hflC protein [Candidatus Endolissoclinum faulkneri L5]|uniref:Protein HflC n=1 Tax=Candidatus Endolissoclinum faulkneri L5 TaxID=1401328 RepID=V9TVC6_9PROT|nr:protease modulator HflC [Candidatus Endolissoclinum faulkneri]AHC73653.1 hflC protein [Candidatus Endolissoclinum faulkneri L5]
MNWVITSICILVGMGVILSQSLFVVNETEQALVVLFGEPVREIRKPGINFKIPLAENTTYYERRALDVDPPRQQVILADQKRLDVDSYARYKIIDPLQFFRAVRAESEAASRLSIIINSSLRRVLGNQTLADVLSKKRARIMTNIKTEVNDSAQRFGMEIIEVRIRRADYPDATKQNIFDRMTSEREREAREFRAQGSEQAQKIRADADKQRTVIVAESQKNAEILRGQGDGQAIKVYTDAFSRDPAFFDFYWSMQAYKKMVNHGNSDTTMVLSLNSAFFKYFNSIASNKPSMDAQ